MDGQMTLDEWMQDVDELRPACKIEHPHIQKLAKDLFEVIKGKKRDEDYAVWDHVPKLGPRYQCWYDDVKNLDYDALDKLKDRYRRCGLELSFDSIPRTTDDGSKVIGMDLFVSSKWSNNKEPVIKCTHNKKCITYCIGCNGQEYWCKRYD